jgi:hypothetical protein
MAETPKGPSIVETANFMFLFKAFLSNFVKFIAHGSLFGIFLMSSSHNSTVVKFFVSIKIDEYICSSLVYYNLCTCGQQWHGGLSTRRRC